MDIKTSQAAIDMSRLLSVRERLRGKGEDQDTKLRKACDDFEAIMLQQMLKGMRQTLSGEDLFGKSMARDMFESLYDQEICTRMAHGRELGIAEMMYKELKEKTNPSR